MFKYFSLFSTCLLFVGSPLTAQHLDYKLGELVIQLNHEKEVDEFLQSLQTNQLTECEIGECISHNLGIYKVHFDHNIVNQQQIMAEIATMDGVKHVQFNHFLKRRRVPDDPEFSQQWHWLNLGMGFGVEDADIDADEAWDVTTGGVTAQGDTIVIGLIENGVELSHPDLLDNMWVNRSEIPGNGIDDDENGFVDDYLGWNVVSQDDNVDPERFGGGQDDHGTKVAGMMGAVGNNGEGITGVNWSVKIMNVKLNPDLNESDMLAAYDYILVQRTLYNETNGAKGAFVVATNLSYGDESLTPEDAPIWCNMYDELGRVGILNSAATANAAIDIDEIKDLPTSCPSDHLISVSSSDNLDQLEPNSAFGLQDIDILAPGEDIYSCTVDGGYDLDAGTSFAAPQIAAATALMYSVQNEQLITLAKSNPEAASLLCRETILSTVDPISGAEDKIASGGRLNLFKVVNAINNLGEIECTALSNFDLDATGDTIQLSWSLTEETSGTGYRIRTLFGLDSDWRYFPLGSSDTMTQIIKSDLLGCQRYQIQVYAICMPLDTSYSDIRSIQTEPKVPLSLLVHEVAKDSVIFVTQKDSGSNTTLMVYFEDSIVFSFLAEADTVVAANLIPCTQYDVVLASGCDTAIQRVTTECAECDDLFYATPEMNDRRTWIDAFLFADILTTSGSNSGFNFFGPNDQLIERGEVYDLEITIGRDETLDSSIQNITVLIDFNQNASFEEDEIVYSVFDTLETFFASTITIPVDAKPGKPRMRVILHDPDLVDYNLPDSSDVEDYCIQIIENCPVLLEYDSTAISTTSAYFLWEHIDSAYGYAYRYKKATEDDDEYIVMVDTANFVSLTELEKCTFYNFQIMTVCNIDTSRWQSVDFMTLCSTSSEDENNVSFSVYPNPFDQTITIDIQGIRTSERLSIQVFDLNGKQIDDWTIPAGTRSTDRLSKLPNGMYYMKVIQNNQPIIVEKIIKL